MDECNLGPTLVFVLHFSILTAADIPGHIRYI